MLHPRLSVPGATERDPEAALEEAVSLVESIDLKVVLAEVVNLPKARPSTLFGSGTVERLRVAVEDLGSGGKPSVVVVNAAVSPVQQRNLERGLGCKVIDRTGLILEIFGARARTKEGTLQVELAALTYQRSRLVRSWTHLERQRGGFGFMGGPGETQIETDRRLIDERITRLKRDLAGISRTRDIQRQARKRVPYPVVALVGYTNAGKSTLFNRLTRSEVFAKDQLFATLDPTLRAVGLPSGRMAILSDTVGFISDLPHELVAAFRATLEEVCEADVIVHVRDAAHPDSEIQKQDVHEVLGELGLETQIAAGLLEVMNKIDLLDPEERAFLENRVHRSGPHCIPASARTGEGTPALLAAIDERLARSETIVDLEVEPWDGKTIAWIYAHGEVIERRDDDSRTALKVRMSPANAAPLRTARRKARLNRRGIATETTRRGNIGETIVS